MNIPLLELQSQYKTIKPEIDEAIHRVLDRQSFILGEEVKALEEEIATYCGSRFGIGTSSGTGALTLALMALGVKAGDEVITTPYTFLSTSSCITRLGARPVYVDITDHNFSIDPDQIESKITEDTKAILPVQFAGQMCDMVKIMEIANRYDLPVVEDACQSIGATLRGQKAGSIGTIGCFSFYPSKNLGGYGDSGMCVTNHVNLASKMRMLRNHGQDPKYYHLLEGDNLRMDEIQAAVLRVKLKHLEDWINMRIRHARLYNGSFRLFNIPLILPSEPMFDRHTYHLYIIRSDRRDWIKHSLERNGIGCGIYYPLPLHLQPCYKYLGYNIGDMPNSERASLTSLAIPVYPELTTSQIEGIVDIIEEALR